MAFERAVSEFGHNYATVAEVGDDGVQRSWTDICRDTWARRELPSCPADFEEQMRTLAFSDNLDRDVVVRLYRTTFQIFSMSTETLVFTDMNWGDEAAIRFARVLPSTEVYKDFFWTGTRLATRVHVPLLKLFLNVLPLPG